MGPAAPARAGDSAEGTPPFAAEAAAARGARMLAVRKVSVVWPGISAAAPGAPLVAAGYAPWLAGCDVAAEGGSVAWGGGAVAAAAAAAPCSRAEAGTGTATEVTSSPSRALAVAARGGAACGCGSKAWAAGEEVVLWLTAAVAAAGGGDGWEAGEKLLAAV